MSNDNKELKNLININEDACEFYETAREKIENPQLRVTLNNLMLLHADVKTSLQAELSSLGNDSEAEETIKGQAAEFFALIASKISNDVDGTWVSHLEEAEDRCLHSMQDAIQNDNVTPATKITLSKELEKLKASHDLMRDLKKNLKSA